MSALRKRTSSRIQVDEQSAVIGDLVKTATEQRDAIRNLSHTVASSPSCITRPACRDSSPLKSSGKRNQRWTDRRTQRIVGVYVYVYVSGCVLRVGFRPARGKTEEDGPPTVVEGSFVRARRRRTERGRTSARRTPFFVAPSGGRWRPAVPTKTTMRPMRPMERERPHRRRGVLPRLAGVAAATAAPDAGGRKTTSAIFSGTLIRSSQRPPVSERGTDRCLSLAACPSLYRLRSANASFEKRHH